MTTSQRARLVLLGTGGGITPKPERQSTAAALCCGKSTYIIDCGNGVGPQLLRARLSFSSVKAIFITHHHLDHAADFGILLAQCWSQLREPVTLVAPPPITKMFQLFLEMFDMDLRGRVAGDGRRPLAELVRVAEFSGPGECYQDSAVRVTASSVPHGNLEHSYAYRFAHSEFSIVFSGDTAPSDNLAEFARGVDVLVHEATYPSAFAGNVPTANVEKLLARFRHAHTPVSEAAAIAHRAGARRLVLSPLVPSTGVADAQWLEAAQKEFSGEIVVGRDLLEIPL